MTTQSHTALTLANGVRIDLLTDGAEFLGFGKIHIGDVLVRCDQVPLRVHVSTPDGFQYTRFFVDRITGGQVHLRAEGRPTLRGDLTDDWEGDLVYPSTKMLRPVSDELTWTFRPCTR